MNAETRDGAAPQLGAGSENCLPIGTRLADFEITGVLGEGGFGIVYVAYDHALQRTVAIKEYMPGALALRADDGSIALRSDRHQDTFGLGLKSFINEARLLAQFDHPALIKVYRFWEQNNTAYTAMKFYQGRTIKEIVNTTPELVDEAWCRKVLYQILQALDTLYTMQILHRDISPDNIIIQENGDAVLLDFGSARQVIGDMTRGLTVILKPGYAPVEQYADDTSLQQGPFTDLYALSAVMYFAITKAPPATAIGRMVNDALVPLTERAPAGYGQALLTAIDKGLAVLAQDRPQTTVAFRRLLGGAALDEAAAPAPLTAPRTLQQVRDIPVTVTAPTAATDDEAPDARTQQPGQSTAPVMFSAPGAAAAPRQRRWLIGAGAAAVLAIAAVGLSALLQAPDDSPPALAAAPANTVAAPTTPVPAPDAVVDAGAAADGAPEQAVAAPGADGAAPQDPPALATTVIGTITPADGEAAAAAVAETKPAPAPTGASYKLRIKPWGTVYVDDKPLGVSPPLKQLTLSPGKHTIRVVNPSFPEYATTIEVGKNKSGAIAHDFSAHAH